MKAKTLILVAVLPAALTLTACNRIKSLVGGTPKGQVVATVNGEEITSTDLATEMGNFTSKDPAIIKAAQQRALQQIIMRDLMAQKAREAKLDKSPEYTVQLRRGEQALLVQLYQRKLVGSVAVPSRQEAEAFILSHPTMFGDRKILVVDQIVAPAGKMKKEQLEALKTLEEVKAMFNTQGIQYQENTAAIDTANTDPRVIAQVEKLPPGEVFIVPQGQALVFNRINSQRSAPITGDVAVRLAQNALRNQKAQDAVKNQMIAMREGAESKIVYNPAFKPDKSFKDSIAPQVAPAAPPAATDGAASAAAPATTPAPATK